VPPIRAYDKGGILINISKVNSFTNTKCLTLTAGTIGERVASEQSERATCIYLNFSEDLPHPKENSPYQKCGFHAVRFRNISLSTSLCVQVYVHGNLLYEYKHPILLYVVSLVNYPLIER